MVQVNRFSRLIRRTMASAALTDSEAALKQQAIKLGLDDEIIEAMVDQKINTLGRLAFAVVPPGQNPTEEQVQAFVTQLLPTHDVCSIATTAVLRRLISESQTTLTAQLKPLQTPVLIPTYANF